VTLTVADLAGYVERHLDADLARWFPDAERVTVGAGTRPVAPFLGRLPAASAAALEAFDRRVRSGTMAQFLDIFDWSYGFDFAANGCGITDADYETVLTDDDVYSIGADGGGNYHVVLTNGQVGLWFHEEEVVEGGTRFHNLDVFVWSAVRHRAVREGRLARAAVEEDFLALGQDGAVEPNVGMLSSLK
jgi:hypothetical protein